MRIIFNVGPSEKYEMQWSEGVPLPEKNQRVEIDGTKYAVDRIVWHLDTNLSHRVDDHEEPGGRRTEFEFEKIVFKLSPTTGPGGV